MTLAAGQDEGNPGLMRPASGITIDPDQLIRLRDLRALSREDLAEHTGEILFDYDYFTGVLSGSLAADARMARVLWTALGCEPGELITGLPPGLPRNMTARWLRQNSSGWSLDTGAVRRLMQQRGQSGKSLAAVAARHWFSRDSVNKIERGERRPKARTLRAFCQILGCTPGDLMPGGRRLPEGRTRARRELQDYNAGMRAFADKHGISYRHPETGRIRYSRELREAWASYLAGQEAGKQASRTAGAG